MEDILKLLQTEGPMTGKAIVDKTGKDSFVIWKFCISSPEIETVIFGNRYLRLDNQVEGYARLSPSILREFSSYTVLALKGQAAAARQLAAALQATAARISAEKRALAREVLNTCLKSQDLSDRFNSSACAIIAGDVVYGMAHRESRPEFSTGRCVNGSDLDIVIITDGLDKADAELLDRVLYQKKYELLTNPLYLEEIDYLIKDTAKVASQLMFDDFKSMIACKILHEGDYLLGSRKLFSQLKQDLIARGISEKLERLEKLAEEHRKGAEISLLAHPGPLLENELIQLFYTTMESEEFY